MYRYYIYRERDIIYIYIYIYIYRERERECTCIPYIYIDALLLFGALEDTVCPFFESDTLFHECCLCIVFSCFAILRIEGCLNSTL